MGPVGRAALAVVSLIAVGCSSPAGSPDTGGPVPGLDAGGSRDAGTSMGGRFYVVGKDLVDPQGRLFFPVGANLISSSFWDFTAQDVGFGYDHIDEVKAWGWNLVRLPEYFYPRYGAQTNEAVLDQYIDAFTAEKIVALVDFHSIESGLWPSEAQMAPAEQEFGRLAKKYKDNPYLWFELINEPGDPTDDGIASGKWVDLHRRLIQAIRGAGAENVIVVMGSDWGQDAQTQAVLQKGEELRAGVCNLAFSFHVYNMWPAEGALEAYATAAQAKSLALIVTEAGFHDGTYEEGWTRTEVESGVRQVYRDLAPLGIGVILWHGMSATSDLYGAVVRTAGTPAQQFGHFYLIDSNTSPTNLTAQGALHWALTHPRPDLGAFTGKLADSHCASAQ